LRFGFYTPNFGFCGDARTLAELAHEAEASGWDGFFVWDHLQFIEPAADPWVALAAMAMRTQRIRLGTLITPVPRRHLAKLAREVTTLDHLSGGRITLGAGAGFATFPEYTGFGDEGDPKVRAAQLDEGLEVLAALWSGNPVKHHGAHYHVECAAFQPPIQRPRVPIWVAATAGAARTIRRAARWDGVAAVTAGGVEVATEDLRRIVKDIAAQRGTADAFDVIRFGKTRDARDTEAVRAAAEAGATWWLESIYTWETTLEAARDRIRSGPPRA
jgi:alkanesulfonate monooxygenase SsuD/methylene tetrahydromethanopterin reductase-like flavin-dependent oxidoreductase (luciferase family)